MMPAPKTQNYANHGIYSRGGRRAGIARPALEREILSLGLGADPVRVGHAAWQGGWSRSALRNALLAGPASLLWGSYGALDPVADAEAIASKVTECLAAFSWLERHGG